MVEITPTIPVEVTVRFRKKDAPDYEELGIEGMKTETVEEPMVMDLSYVSGFMESSSGPDETCVHLNGTPYGIGMTYHEFKKVYTRETGKIIKNYCK